MADQTFSIDPGQAMLQGAGQGPSAAPVAFSALGSTSAPAQGSNAKAGLNDATVNAMLKLGGDILAPRIKQAQQQQFMDGVKQAMTGEALTDIVAERPWYTEIFGPSSAVQGARAYTVASTVAKFGADMERQMPKLAEQGPEALDSAVKGLTSQLMTGDAAADAAITSQVVDQMAPLYKRHAKEHYLYQQRRASDAQVDAWSSLGAAYQQRAAAAATGDKTVSPKDVQADADRLIGNMSPFADQSVESYELNVSKFLEASARAGNFQVVKLFKEKGFFDQLPPENRAKLEGTFKVAGAQALSNAMPTFALDVAMIVNDTAQDPRKLPARVAELNAKAAAMTGVDLKDAQLIPNSTLDNVTGSILRAQATAAAKQHEADLAAARAKALIYEPGGAVKGKAIGFVKDTDLEAAVLGEWTAQANDPAKRAQLLNASPTEAYSGIKVDLQNSLSSEEVTPGTQRTANLYAALTDEARGAYFSSDQQKFLDRYNSYVNSGEQPAAAWQRARIVQPLSKYVLDAKEKDESAKSIRKWVEDKAEDVNGAAGWIGINGIDDNGIRVLQVLTGRQLATGRGINTMDTSVKRAMSEVLTSGKAEIVGKSVILNAQAGTTPVLQELMKGKDSMGHKEAAAAFETFIQDKAKAMGSPLHEYLIQRLPDGAGQSRFVVENTDDKGAVQTFYFTAAEIRATGAKAYTETAAKAAKVKADINETSSDPEREAWFRERNATWNPIR